MKPIVNIGIIYWTDRGGESDHPAHGRPDAARSETGDPLLLTPGPLTTSAAVKQAMVHDWGSRDQNFIAINEMVLERIAELAGATGTHVTVPMQGTGTFAVEAMITTFVPKTGKLLLLINGAYGSRARKIAEIAGRAVATYETPEDTPPDLGKLDAALAPITAITHVFAVHCETTSGILNPIGEIAAWSEARPPAAGRFDEGVRRARDRRARGSLRRHGLVLEQVPRGRARPGLRRLPQRGARRVQGQRHDPGARPPSTRRRISPRPGSTASRRRSTSSWRSARRSRSTRPRAAWPAAARATAPTPRC